MVPKVQPREILDKEDDKCILTEVVGKAVNIGTSLECKVDNILQSTKRIEKKLSGLLETTDSNMETHTTHLAPTRFNQDMLSLHEARSLQDLEKLGIAFDRGTKLMICNTCNDVSDKEVKADLKPTGVFEYDPEQGTIFKDEYFLPQQFRNLKRSTKRH